MHSNEDVVTERTPLLQPVPVPPLLSFPQSSSSIHSTSASPQPQKHRTTRELSGLYEVTISDWFRIFASLKQGHLPDTLQLLELISYLLDTDFFLNVADDDLEEGTTSRYRGRSRLSEKGEKFRKASREFLISLKELVLERNGSIKGVGMEGKGKEKKNDPDDGWQEFIWSLRFNKIKSAPPRIPSTFEEEEESFRTSSKESNLVTSTFLNLLTLFFTSVEIRQLVVDLIVLCRDIVQVILRTEIKEDRIPKDIGRGIEKVVDSVAKEGVEKVNLGKVGKEQIESENWKREEGPESSRPAMTAPDPPLVDLGSTEEEADQAETVPTGQTVEELSDTFMDRFKNIVLRIQSTPEYQTYMTTLLSLLREYLKHSISSLKPTVSIEPTAATTSNPSTPHLYDGSKSPLSLLVPLLEPFTGGKGTSSPLVSSYDTTLSHFSPSSTNPSSTSRNLKEFFTSIDQFISQALLEPRYFESKEVNETLSRISKDLEGLKQSQPEFWKDFQSFLRETVRVMDQVYRDEYLNRFIESGGSVLVATEEWVGIVGEKSIKATVGGQGLGVFWEDILDWFLPRILGILKEIPIPRIEFSSPQLDGALEFPTLLSTSLIPMEFTIKNSTSLTYLPTLGTTHQDLPSSTSSSKSPPPPPPTVRPRSSWLERTAYASKTNLSLKGIEFEILDVGYFIKLKPPSILGSFSCCCNSLFTESGLLDLHFGSTTQPQKAQPQEEDSTNGFSVSLDLNSLESEVEQTRKLFNVLPSSQVDLSHFDLKFHETRGWLTWFVRPLAKVAVRKAIEMEMRKLMIEQGDKLGEWSYRLKEKKKEEDEKDSADRFETSQSRGVWNWIKAAWRIVTEDDIDAEEKEEEEQVSKTQTSTTVHLNRHGVSLDLPRPVDHDASREVQEGATVGIGTEGVVIPEGEAPIPVPPEQERIGIVNKARQEVDEAVESGQRIAKNTLEVVGEIGEASEEWRGDLEEEKKKFERDGWRSDAFDLRRRRRHH
ncbi:hypothetical protein JCM5350_007731 [Sporobolomyces pararoseus]